MTKLGDTRIAGKGDVAPSNGTTTEAKTEDRQPAFEPEEAFFELNASGLGFGEDEVAKVEGFGRDHPSPESVIAVLVPPLGFLLLLPHVRGFHLSGLQFLVAVQRKAASSAVKGFREICDLAPPHPRLAVSVVG